MSEPEPSTASRATITLAAAAVGILAALAVTVLVFTAASFYGPAWASLERAHGAAGASLAVGAVTGVACGAAMGWTLARGRLKGVPGDN